MNGLRKLGVAIALGLLPVTLFGFGLLFSAHRVVGTPDAIKGALREGGIYNTAVADLIQQAQKQEDGSIAQATDEIPTDREEVKTAIQGAFPSALLEEQFGNVLDDTYAWIQGETNTLAFEIDLSEAKPKLAESLGGYAQNRVASLPVCPANTPISGDLDAFNATCRPEGLDPAVAAAQAKQEILQSEFFERSTFGTEDLKNGEGKTLDQQLSQVPEVYNKVVLGIYLSGIGAVVMIAAAILLSNSKRSGIRRSAVIVLSVGLMSTLLAWLSSFVVSQLIDNVAKTSANEALQIKLLGVVHILINDLRTWWMALGIILTILGIGTLIVLRLTRPKVDMEELAHHTSETPNKPTTTPPTVITH